MGVLGTFVLIVFHIHTPDPQDEVSGDCEPEQAGAHTDWLTLNIGGRLFTTTRQVVNVWEMYQK